MLGGVQVVSNATPLIHLARAGGISLLKSLFTQLLIPEEVHREVCLGKETPDAVLLRAAVEEGWIKVARTEIEGVMALAKAAGVHRGEAAAILLAKANDALLLIDDKMGRTAAEMLGIRCIGTIGVLLMALNRRMVSLKGFESILNRMTDLGFRIDASLYREVLRRARKISKRANDVNKAS